MNRSLAWASLAVTVLVLTGCADSRPFVTSAPHEEPPADAAGKVVAICYNAASTTREEVYTVAEKQCEKVLDGRKLEFDHLELWRHDTVFNDCPIFSKTRVSFICRPLPEQ